MVTSDQNESTADNAEGDSAKTTESSASEFEKASQDKQTGFLREWVQFIVENKYWWLVPIMLCLGVFGILLALAATGGAPFIYALF